MTSFKNNNQVYQTVSLPIIKENKRNKNYTTKKIPETIKIYL